MNTRFISPNLTIVLVTASIAACTVPGKDPLNLNQTSEDETPVTCSGSEAACLGQNVSGFTADAAPPVTRDAEWAESLKFEVDEISEGVDADDADARERVEIELFPPTSLGALLSDHFHAVGSYALTAAIDYEESLKRVREAQPESGALLLDTYARLDSSARRDRLWILYTLGALLDERALPLFEQVASDPSLPDPDGARSGERVGELMVRSFAVLGLRRLAGAGLDEAADVLLQLVGSEGLSAAVRHRAVDALVDLGFDPRQLDLSTGDMWVLEVERPDQPPSVAAD